MSVLPLQDMIAGAIKTASAKIASEAHKEPEKVKKLLAYEKKEHGHIPSPHEEEVECESKEKMAYAALISDDHVEKLASAVDFLATHLGDIAAPGPIAQALAKTAMKPGAGGGTAGGKSVPNPASAAGALETTQAIGGSQKYTKNKAKGEQAEDEHNKGLERNEGNPHGAKTHLETNYHEAPGNNHGSVPHHEYPAKGPLVAGPSGAHNKGTNAASLKTASFAGKGVPVGERSADVLSRSAVIGRRRPNNIRRGNRRRAGANRPSRARSGRAPCDRRRRGRRCRRNADEPPTRRGC